MASYLLLRSNKKSGPYSLQDLVNFGLKAYDLVWVEGKSAAWRYPSEVEELKPYAPGTEEQPYDRFFKKKSGEKKEEPLPVMVEEEPRTVVSEKTQPKPVEELPFIEPQYEKYIPKKSVFVTLPGQKMVAVQRPVAPIPVRETQSVQASEPVITVKENPAAQVKYSQPLDEIKEMYVKTLQDRKSKIARKSFVMVNLKRASVIVGLVAVGALAGYLIRSKGNSNTSQAALLQQVLRQPAVTADPLLQQKQTVTQLTEEKDIPADNKVLIPEAPPKVTPGVEERLAQLERQQLSQQKLSQEKLTKQQTPSFPVDKDLFEDKPVVSKPVETNPVTGERTRQVRSENQRMEAGSEKAIMKPVTRNLKSGLESMVSIVSNEYTRVAFGGIRNLELTVVNDSKYILDKVTVELQYLKPSEEPLKTELVQFHSVSPNGSMTMRIKDTNRGIKVTYKIIDIQSGHTETAFQNN